MPKNSLAASLFHPLYLTTDSLACQLSLQPQSIRKRYAATGTYHGVRPVKLPNRRLMWPANAVEQLIKEASDV